MARIRTIKPEFPHSESMGRVSRDARLLFIHLWTLCDDSGRTRGNSRMLASLLFPYDDDAPKLIDGWIEELERECCIVRYTADGTSYMQVCNWLNHQKIDKPSASKIPAFDESSRIIANNREPSSLDQGSRIKDQVSKDHKKDIAPNATEPKFDAQAHLLSLGVGEHVAAEWIALKKRHKSVPTELVIKGMVREAGAARIALSDAMTMQIENGWKGFKAEYALNQVARTSRPAPINGRQAAVSNYAAQAAAARAQHELPPGGERDITGEAIRVT